MISTRKDVDSPVSYEKTKIKSENKNVATSELNVSKSYNFQTYSAKSYNFRTLNQYQEISKENYAEEIRCEKVLRELDASIL